MNTLQAVLKPQVEPVALANGTTTTAAIDQSKGSITGIIIPAGLTGTAFTFTGSDALAGTYSIVKDSTGADISLTVASSRVVALTPTQQAQLAAVPFLKIVSGTSQSGAITLNVLKRGLI
jgi:hypothetical protein